MENILEMVTEKLALEIGNRYPMYVDTYQQDQEATFLTHLPSFLGNVVINSEGETNLDPWRKPILVVATSAESLRDIQHFYSRDSFLVRNGVIKCYQRGTHYSVCSFPQPFHVDIDKHDVIVCTYSCYKTLPRAGFRTVVVHRSNLLEVQENRDLILHFMSRTVLLRGELPDDHFYDREVESISLTYEVSKHIPAPGIHQSLQTSTGQALSGDRVDNSIASDSPSTPTTSDSTSEEELGPATPPSPISPVESPVCPYTVTAAPATSSAEISPRSRASDSVCTFESTRTASDLSAEDCCLSLDGDHSASDSVCTSQSTPTASDTAFQDECATTTLVSLPGYEACKPGSAQTASENSDGEGPASTSSSLLCQEGDLQASTVFLPSSGSQDQTSDMDTGSDPQEISDGGVVEEKDYSEEGEVAGTHRRPRWKFRWPACLSCLLCWRSRR